MRTALTCLCAVVVIVMLPASTFGQATITGTARDATGAVLPGVTVEAASSALIKKVRTAVTDGSGKYRIIDPRSVQSRSPYPASRRSGATRSSYPETSWPP